MMHYPRRLSTLLRLALLASVLSLSFALLAEYGFGLKPCHLCLAQRVPYGVVILLALLGMAKPQGQFWVAVAVGITFLAGAGIAGYHVAVEKQWVSGPSGCTNGDAPAGQSTEDFLKRIQQAPIVACDQPQWEVFGISMAGMNFAWSLALGAGTFVALQQIRRKHPAHA